MDRSWIISALCSGPDPGQYFRLQGPSGPAHSFPSGKRGGGATASAGSADSPGPADHSVDLDSRGGPAWTLAGRLDDGRPTDSPGPGKGMDEAQRTEWHLVWRLIEVWRLIDPLTPMADDDPWLSFPLDHRPIQQCEPVFPSPPGLCGVLLHGVAWRGVHRHVVRVR
jgi:hypothetical protein